MKRPSDNTQHWETARGSRHLRKLRLSPWKTLGVHVTESLLMKRDRMAILADWVSAAVWLCEGNKRLKYIGFTELCIYRYYGNKQWWKKKVSHAWVMYFIVNRPFSQAFLFSFAPLIKKNVAIWMFSLFFYSIDYSDYSVLLVHLHIFETVNSWPWTVSVVLINHCTEKQTFQGIITQGQYWVLSTWTEKNREEVQRWRVEGGLFRTRFLENLGMCFWGVTWGSRRSHGSYLTLQPAEPLRNSEWGEKLDAVARVRLSAGWGRKQNTEGGKKTNKNRRGLRGKSTKRWV